MAYSTAIDAFAPAFGHPRSNGGRDALYKTDHPRAIDRYIDFFGTGLTRGEVDDRCGELFLETLA